MFHIHKVYSAWGLINFICRNIRQRGALCAQSVKRFIGLVRAREVCIARDDDDDDDVPLAREPVGEFSRRGRSFFYLQLFTRAHLLLAV